MSFECVVPACEACRILPGLSLFAEVQIARSVASLCWSGLCSTKERRSSSIRLIESQAHSDAIRLFALKMGSGKNTLATVEGEGDMSIIYDVHGFRFVLRLVGIVAFVPT